MSRNSKPPITSLQSYSQVGEMRVDHHTRILYAMKVLAVPSSMHKIAEKSGMDNVQIARRMNELELDGLVEKAGKGLSATNRPCALYRLVHQPTLSQVQVPEAIDLVNQLELFG